MSKYTMELRKVCDIYTRETVESWFKNYNIEDYLTESQVESIENAGLWDKNKLAKKIVDHYFMREIGFETPYLFRHYAIVTMQEIMEEKLPLIYSNSIQYDPLVNVDFTETLQRTIEGTGSNNSIGSSSSSSSSSSNSLGISNNTPQTRVTRQDINNGLYASNVSQGDNSSSIEDETETNSTLTSENEQTESYTKRIKGNSGVSATAQKMVEQYRDNIIAIDKEIIESLYDLFMGLY